TADLNGRAAGDVAKDVQTGLDKISVPSGYKVTQGGDAQSQNETFGQILTALGLSVLLMYMLMVALFERFVFPLMIMFSLPLAVGPTRVRPMLMTTSALVLAMSPIALKLGEGSEWRAPMAVTVIGGLLTSTLLTLVLIPAVYTIMDDFTGALSRAPKAVVRLVAWRPARRSHVVEPEEAP